MSNPYMALAHVMKLFDKSPKPTGRIHSKAVIASSAILGENVTIESNAVIGSNVVIGDNVFIGACSAIDSGTVMGNETIIKSNVSISYDIKIGNQCVIHQNAVIGCNGFDNAQAEDGRWLKIPQLGRVII